MWSKRRRVDTPTPPTNSNHEDVRFATTIEPLLLDTIVRFDVEMLSIAGVNRLAGLEADRLGMTRPSYDAVRRIVIAERCRRRERREALLTAADELWAYRGVDYSKLTDAMLATRRSTVHRARVG
jgi:hypothetical protein